VDAWEAATRRQKAETLQTLSVKTASETLNAENIVVGSPVQDRIPDVGEEVLVRVRDLGLRTYATMREHARDRWLVRLAGAVSVVIVVIFGRKGARALAALVLSVGIVLTLPRAIVAVQGGVFAFTLAGVFLALACTYFIICGPTRKALGAMGGAFLGITIGGLLALWAAWMSGLSGLHDLNMAAIRCFSAGRVLDFRALLVAGILLGTIGVVMDVAIAVASAVSELARAAPELSMGEIRKRGMAVGGKVMGAMVMAIALAYMGINFGLFLLPYVEPGTRLSDVLGTERVIAEVLRLLVGATAVVWTVPATAWLAAWLEKRRRANTAQPRAQSGRGFGQDQRDQQDLRASRV